MAFTVDQGRASASIRSPVSRFRTLYSTKRALEAAIGGQPARIGHVMSQPLTFSVGDSHVQPGGVSRFYDRVAIEPDTSAGPDLHLRPLQHG